MTTFFLTIMQSNSHSDNDDILSLCNDDNPSLDNAMVTSFLLTMMTTFLLTIMTTFLLTMITTFLLTMMTTFLMTVCHKQQINEAEKSFEWKAPEDLTEDTQLQFRCSS